METKKIETEENEIDIHEVLKILCCEYIEIETDNHGIKKGHPIDIKNRDKLRLDIFIRILDKYHKAGKIKRKNKLS